MTLEAMNEYDIGILLFTCFVSIGGEHTQLCCLMGLEGQSNPYLEQLVEPARAAPWPSFLSTLCNESETDVHTYHHFSVQRSCLRLLVEGRNNGIELF
jgi:hypothetical protein